MQNEFVYHSTFQKVNFNFIFILSSEGKDLYFCNRIIRMPRFTCMQIYCKHTV